MLPAAAEVDRLVKERGMRPGRAIRRMYDGTDDDIGALARAWGRVTIRAGADHISDAYTAVHSCMSREPARTGWWWAAMGAHIAVMCAHDGVIVARALVHEDRHGDAYGPEAYALGLYLEHVLGIRYSARWADGLMCDVADLVSARLTSTEPSGLRGPPDHTVWLPWIDRYEGGAGGGSWRRLTQQRARRIAIGRAPHWVGRGERVEILAPCRG